MYKKVKRGWIKHIDFMIIDLCCIQISFILSYMIRIGLHLPYLNPLYSKISIFIIILHFCIVFFLEPYSGVLRRGYLKELKASIRYSCILIASLLVLMYLLQLSDEYSRIVFVIFWASNCVLIYSSHVLYKYYLRRRLSDDKKSEHMYLVTTSNLVHEITEGLVSNEYSNFLLKGIIVLDTDMVGKTIGNIPVVANSDTMLEFIKSNIVDEVFIGLKDDSTKTDVITEYCLKMGITVHINIERLLPDMPNTTVGRINDFTIITTCINTASARDLLLKRLLDVCGGIVGLLVTGIAFIIFAPIIYIQSPGPIFFSQERVGKNGRRFKIYKFRSMYMDAEEKKKELMEQNKMKGFMFKMDNDPRITPIGKFLRKTSIDELPQFYNVLKGDMSLVGTRPPTVDEYQQYELHHKKRLSFKPGLTGMWQVSGRSNITDFEKVVELDTHYIKEWSMGLDIKILFKTIKVVFVENDSM